MRKTVAVILTLTSALMIGGCFNFGEEGGENVGTEAGYTVYKTDDFSIDVPDDWEVINEDEFTSAVPEVTVVVFRNNVKNETFTANVNIVAKDLQEAVSSEEYAKMVINRESSGLVDYKELTKETVEIKSGGGTAKTLMNRFEARKTASESLFRYIQIYGVKGNKGYIVSGAVSPQESESVLQTVEKIVKSFRLN